MADPDIIRQQQNMKDIMSAELSHKLVGEYKRKTAVQTENRNIVFSTNLQKRRFVYLMVVFIWIGAFLVLFALAWTIQFFPRIPHKIISMMVLFIAVVWTADLLFDLSKRNPLNYDEYNWNSPQNTVGNIQNAKLANNGAGTHGICMNEKCCSPGTQYDAAKATCVLVPPAATATPAA